MRHVDQMFVPVRFRVNTNKEDTRSLRFTDGDRADSFIHLRFIFHSRQDNLYTNNIKVDVTIDS